MEFPYVREAERGRERKNGVIQSLEDYSEDFCRGLDWIEIYEDYHWYYEICRNLML